MREERATGTDTGIRFTLLVILLITATFGMALDLITQFSGHGNWGCLLAAGGDPDQDVAVNYLLVWPQWDLFEQCRSHYMPPPPWWVPPLAALSLLLVAIVLVFVLPLWKARRGKVVELAAVDRDGSIRRELEASMRAAGVSTSTRFVVDPTAPRAGAVVFGRTRRAVVALQGGLLVRRRVEPDRYLAVVTHELAHIRNGDVTITYLTVALWRVFLVTVLTPYVLDKVGALTWRRTHWHGDIPTVTRDLVLAAVLVALIHLARADILRAREIHADRTAVRLGADPRGWVFPAPEFLRGRWNRAVASFTELWRTHPRWDIRRGALTDPVTLYTPRALQFFLAGFATAIISSYLSTYVGDYRPDRPWTDEMIGVVVGGIVTAVAGYGVFAATVFSVRDARPAPSSARPGLWLGAGTALGALITNQIVLADWVPRNPLAMALPLGAGAAAMWWIRECTTLWLERRPGRSARLVAVLVLLPAWSASAAWFAWWNGGVATIGQGFVPSAPMMTASLLEGMAPVSGHRIELTVVGATFTATTAYTTSVLAPIAVTALWIVPLLAWVRRPRGPVGTVAVPGLAPLGSISRTALGGAAVGFGAAVLVRMYTHSWRPWDFDVPSGSGFIAIHILWTLAALLLGCVVTAIAITVRYHRFRLLTALIATQITLAAEFAAVYALTVTDGCVTPLDTHRSTCGWRVELAAGLLLFLPALCVFATIVAVVIAALTLTAYAVHDRIRGASDPRPHPPVRGNNRAARWWVAVLCLLAVTVTVWDVTTAVTRPRAHLSAADMPQNVVALRAAVIPPHTVAVQATAWYEYGGGALYDHWDRSKRAFVAAMTEVDGDPSRIDRPRLRSICADLRRTAADSEEYFRLPYTELRKPWQVGLRLGSGGSADCLRALDHPGTTEPDPGDALGTATAELSAAYLTVDKVLELLAEQIETDAHTG